MTSSRELRSRLEVLPARVEAARAGTDPQTEAEVRECQDRLRALRATLARADEDVEVKKKALWTQVVLLRRRQAAAWERMNSGPRLDVPLWLPLTFGAVISAIFFENATDLAASWPGFVVLALAGVAGAGWWGFVRERSVRALEEADRAL